MATPLKTLSQVNRLKDAEEYFEFFGLVYDPQTLNINRLHILRKFSQLVQEQAIPHTFEHSSAIREGQFVELPIDEV
ncbi:MAG: nitrogenase-stabilizing/protective protein NifW, partial [Phormidesmis sp.]